MKMKKTLSIITGALLLAASCTNLDEEIYSKIPKDTFLNDEANIALYTSRPYTMLQKWGNEQSMLTLIMQLSNEVAIPKAYSGSWGEPRYSEVQTHNIPPSNKLSRCGWDFCFDGIAACNDAIYELEKLEQNDAAKKNIAEVKVLRAYYYLLAVDCFGNVPFSVNKTETDYPKMKDRAFMLNWIEQEIADNIEYLDYDVNASTYGRVTKGVAQFILAKIYLNSEVWTGTKRYGEAEKICKELMDGRYRLADTYKANFSLNNENGPEAIMAIPYSSTYTKQGFYIYMMTFNDDLQRPYKIGETWNGSMICQPDFFETYEAGDTRKSDTWLYGQVYNADGSPYTYASVTLNPDGSTTTQNLPYILDGSLAAMPAGEFTTGIGRFDGARIIKWPYQTDGSLTNYQVSMENDFYLMRYSDVVLMYVEALIRQGRTADAAAVEEFKKIRTRAGLSPMSASELTLDNFLLERQHELCMEGWSRQDLIRFGKYTEAWWAKPKGIDEYKLLPIPDLRMGDNPNLVQNPGYDK